MSRPSSAASTRFVRAARLACPVAYLVACAGALVPVPSGAQALPDTQTGNAWFISAARSLQEKLDAPIRSGNARNVILFVGTGMGVSTQTAARILEGQQRGEPGEENRLSFERFAHTALVKTYAIDAQVADTAASMTALLSGVKSDAGLLGVDADAERGRCASGVGNELVSALELAELGGIATGILTTTRLTQAGAAAAYASSVERDWEDDARLSAEAVADGCEDIASQLVSFESRVEARHARRIDGIEVAIGSGRGHFLPREADGLRRDGRHLLDEWQASYPQGRLVSDASSLAAVPGVPVLGVFDDSADRPSLTAMTRRAITLLAPDPDGYLLIVVADDIGQAHAAGNASAALNATIELSRAVRAADEQTDPNETLILVTADQGQSLTIAGYPRRGNPVLGKVVASGKSDPFQASDALPYTTLGYANGRGFRVGRGGSGSAGRVDLRSIDTTGPDFHQTALVPLDAVAAAGEDVVLHATGAGAGRVNGVIEQNVVFHVMERALGLLDRATVEAGR